MSDHVQSVYGRKSEADRELSAIGLFNVLLRHYRLILWIPVGFAVLALGAGLLVRSFVAESSFVPESPSADLSGLAGLASQFGVSVPQVQAGESLDFYAQLVTSRDVLEEALESRFTVSTSSDDVDEMVSGSLLEILEIEGEDRTEQIQNGVEWLRGNIDVNADAAAGIVHVRTAAPWSDLAEALNLRLLDLINTFNLERRQSRAGAEREFVEGQAEDARQQLRAAEEDLEEFLDSNRMIESSPQLMFERDRLRRRVDLRQQVYTSLVQSLEQAKIEEVRNTPVITIISSPEGTAEPSESLPMMLLFGLLVGGALAVGLAFSREYLDWKRSQGDSDYREFEELRSAIAAHFRARGVGTLISGRSSALPDGDGGTSISGDRPERDGDR